MSTDEYLRGAETMRRRELVWGVVREPPAPLYGHQDLLTRLTVMLVLEVRRLEAGRVVVAPVDVVLDEERALVVQPDLVFISQAREHIIDRRIWGAPDLVVEVLSWGTARRDRTTKLNWYREYGVLEYWLVDPFELRVEVVRLRTRSTSRRVYEKGAVLRSGVIRGLRLSVEELFAS